MQRNLRLGKIKNKNYNQSDRLSIKQIKLNSKQSFQKLITTNQQFDDYINKIYTRMVEQQTDNPILIIPKHFKQFVNSKLFKQLLKQIFQYMIMLQQYQINYKRIVVSNNLQSNHLMTFEAHELQKKCKEISYVYMGILLSYGQSKFIFKDQYFFQTMIYLIEEILKQNFQAETYPMIDEELNRIFRTDTFNLIKRRYHEDKAYKKYPQLKEIRYTPTPQGDKHLINQLKTRRKLHFGREKSPETGESLPKPMNFRQSASKSIYSRSPLISSFYPSGRQKMYSFREYQNDGSKIIRGVMGGRSMSMK